MSVPMRLPSTMLPVVPFSSATPRWPLAEITLPAPVAAPPIMLPAERATKTPSKAFATDWVPVTSVPRKLPRTMFSSASTMLMACWPLPEMTLRSAWVVPPMRVCVAVLTATRLWCSGAPRRRSNPPR
jgi:hypothetical protein